VLGPTMKKLLFLTVLLSQQVFAGELSAEQCKSLYQAWVFNTALEDACHLDRCVSYQIGVIAKTGCEKILTSTVRDDLSRQVLIDVRNDISKNGQKAFCEYSTKGHEDLKEGNKLCVKDSGP